MSFRKSKNITDRWRAFCKKHIRYLSKLPRLASIFSSADRYDQFLQTGVFDDNEDSLTIVSLTEEEWVPFSRFATQYADSWETYFVRTTYVAYHRERTKRGWQPSAPRFTVADFQLPRLIVHYWAAWNGYDLKMDANLESVMEQFAGRVQFRSIDFDNPEFQDVRHDAGVIHVPTLVFYREGRVDQLFVGVLDSANIIEAVEAWLDSR